jgi:hypothetical protein
MKRSTSLARVRHEEKSARRRRRHHAAKYKPNPMKKVPKWAWWVGGIAAAGAVGYFGWQYLGHNVSVTPGATVNALAGNITVNFGGTVTDAAVSVSGGTPQTAQIGVQTNSTSFQGVSGTTYTAAWVDSSMTPQTATIVVS